jgi:hypothetical protein
MRQRRALIEPFWWFAPMCGSRWRGGFFDRSEVDDGAAAGMDMWREIAVLAAVCCLTSLVRSCEP